MEAFKWPSEGLARIPYWVYSSPAIYERERERIFRGPYWNYVALECEIPNPGDYKRSYVGDLPVVVVRDGEGAIRVFENRCAHRGVQFCQSDCGNAREFMCPYHQWTYDLSGNLIGIPFKRGVKRQGGMPKDFDNVAHGLHKLQVTTRHGVIFASLSDKVEPLESYLGPKMTGYFDRVFDGSELRLLGYSRQRIPCNWKLMVENIKDPYHASLLHVFLVTFGLFRADNPSKVEMEEATGRHSVLVSQKGEQKMTEETRDMKSLREELKLHDPNLLTPVREFPGDATVVMQTLWPMLIIQQQSNTLAMRHIVPAGPESFDLHWTYFGYKRDSDEMTAIRLRQANLMGLSGFVSGDDSEVLEFSQNGVHSARHSAGVLEMGGHGVEDTPHMVTESAIRAFYKYYAEVMDL